MNKGEKIVQEKVINIYKMKALLLGIRVLGPAFKRSIELRSRYYSLKFTYLGCVANEIGNYGWPGRKMLDTYPGYHEEAFEWYLELIAKESR